MNHSSDHPFDYTELLEQVRRGDASAQEELVRQLWPLVSGQISGMCPRRETVEDLAQDVFVKVFTRLKQYQGGSFEGWVRQIARRTCYDALRKQRVRPESTFSEMDELEMRLYEQELAPPDTLSHDTQHILDSLFRRLPPATVWLIKEVELKERPISEVAREMGWSLTAGRLRLMRARRLLKKEYELWINETL